MAIVNEDLVNGHNLREILGGFDVTRIFRITNLAATPPLQLIEAAQTPGVPILSDPYDPAWPRLLCVARDFVPDGPNAARADIRFSTLRNVSTYNQAPLDPATENDGLDVKQIKSGTRELTTTRDIFDAPMLLTPPTSRGGNGASTNPQPSYLSEAKVLVPAGELVFERPETTVAADRARSLVGRVNNPGIGQYGAGTLLFKDLDAQSDDGGNTWNCTYSFLYDFTGWKHRDAWHSDQGKVPEDAPEVEFDVIFRADFSVLDLDFGDAQNPIT